MARHRALEIMKMAIKSARRLRGDIAMKGGVGKACGERKAGVG